MSAWEQIAALPLWALGPMAVGLGIMAWRGWWRPDSLADAPSRAIGLGAMDLMIGAGLFLMGQSLGAMLVQAASDRPLTVILLARLAGQLLGLGTAALYLAVRAAWADDGLRRIGYRPRQAGRDIRAGLVGALLAVAVIPGVMLLCAIVGLLLGQPPPPVGHAVLAELRDHKSLAVVGLIVTSAVVLAPVLEEAVYRGLWQSLLVEALGEHRRWPAVLIAATIFAAVHTGGVAWQALPALWVLGVMLGWTYERTGSLLPPILIHAVFNAFNIGFVLLWIEPAGG